MSRTIGLSDYERRQTRCSCPTCRRMDRDGYRLTPEEKFLTREALKWVPPIVDGRPMYAPQIAERIKQEERLMIENALRRADAEYERAMVERACREVAK